jgi:hypothetical protein
MPSLSLPTISQENIKDQRWSNSADVTQPVSKTARNWTQEALYQNSWFFSLNNQARLFEVGGGVGIWAGGEAGVTKTWCGKVPTRDRLGTRGTVTLLKAM